MNTKYEDNLVIIPHISLKDGANLNRPKSKYCTPPSMRGAKIITKLASYLVLIKRVQATIL